MQAQAERVKRLADVQLPRVPLWNYDGVCEPHRAQGLTKPSPDCVYQECGGDLFGAQRVGVTWMYLRGSGIVADDPGFGKWVQMLFLACLLHSRGELGKRALFVVQTPSLQQCVEQSVRWAPGMAFEYVTGRMSKAERYRRYCDSWDLLIVGHTIARADVEQLSMLGPFDLFFSDDVDELLNPSNATHRAIVKLSKLSERAFVCNATTLQTRLEQLIAADWRIWGSRFRYCCRPTTCSWI
jgi:reverse gyrase